jgi:hypothetical protein
MTTVTNSQTPLAPSTRLHTPECNIFELQDFNTCSLNISYLLIDIKIKRNTSAPFAPFPDGTELKDTADRLVQVRVLDVGTKESSMFLCHLTFDLLGRRLLANVASSSRVCCHGKGLNSRNELTRTLIVLSPH